MMLPVEVASLGLDPATRTPVVLLAPADGPALYADRVMPIQIGGYEASAILTGLRGLRAPRPGAYDLATAIIQRSNLELLRVEIYGFKDSVFYARLVFDIDGAENTLESRPSDAMAIAARLDVPVFADEHLFVQHSLPKNAVHVHEGPTPAVAEAAQQMAEQVAIDPDDIDFDALDDEEVMGPLMNALGSLMEMISAQTGATGIGVDMRVMGMIPGFTERPQAKHAVDEGDVDEFKSFLENITPSDFT